MASDDERRVALVAELQTLIQPFQGNSEEPTFSIEQLTMMSIFILKAASSGRSQRWMYDNFPYFVGQKLDSDFGRIAESDDRIVTYGRSRYDDIEPQTEELFLNPYAPVRILEAETDESEAIWTYTSVEEVRIYFAPILPPSRPAKDNDFFDFQGLPAEIRNVIYSMVLCFPKSGVSVSPKRCGDGKAYVISRDVDDRWDPHAWHSRSIYDPSMFVPLRTHLSLLMVNKQTYSEAMPIFFADNTFVFRDRDKLYHFLFHLSADRSRHLKHIAISYLPERHDRKGHHYLTLFSEACGKLAGLSLRRMDLFFREYDGESGWQRSIYELLGPSPLKALDEQPAVLELLEACSKLKSGSTQVHINGRCPKLARLIEKRLGQYETGKRGEEREKGKKESKASVEL